MSRLSIICLFILLLAGYLGYDKFTTSSKELKLASEKMLTQIAYKEKWFNVMKAINEVSKGNASYNTNIESAHEEGSNINAFGKIEYISQSVTFCQWVDFSFKMGSLNNYKINSQYNCSDQ